MMLKALCILTALALFALIAGAAVYIDAFILEPHWLQVTNITIVDPELSRLLGGLTLVQLSDTHFRGPSGFLEKSILKELDRIRPGVIFITGDFVSRRVALDDFLTFVSRMKPGIYVYGVPGDDDEAMINDTWLSGRWKKSGMALLVDEVVPVIWPRTGGKRLWLVGANYSSDWAGIMEKVPPGEPVIVLAHRPRTVKPAALAGADLVLAGDTHGTQVGIAPLRKFSAYANRGPYIAGLYKVKDSLLYVNRGTGWKARSMRFFCRPELTVFRFTGTGEMEKLTTLPGDES